MGKVTFSGFSGEIGVFNELGQYDLLYILWDYNMSREHTMKPVHVGYTPGPSQNQTAP